MGSLPLDNRKKTAVIVFVLIVIKKGTINGTFCQPSISNPADY